MDSIETLPQGLSKDISDLRIEPWRKLVRSLTSCHNIDYGVIWGATQNDLVYFILQ